MKPRAYKMLRDSKLEPAARAGVIVFDFLGCDYGCSRDDYSVTGVEHVAVTLKVDGGEPFFTVPVGDLEPFAMRSFRRSA